MSIVSEHQIDDYIDNFIMLDEDYRCAICLDIMNDPFQLNCGHRLCNPCIKRIDTCPLCNITISNKFHDIGFQRRLNNINIKCPNCFDLLPFMALHKHIESCEGIEFEEMCKYGCEDILKNKSALVAHYNECPRMNITCIYSAFGCEHTCERRDMDVHMDAHIQEHFDMAHIKYERRTISGLFREWLNKYK